MATQTGTTSPDGAASTLARAIDAAIAVEAQAGRTGLDRRAVTRLRRAWREADALASAALAGTDDEARRLARLWLEIRHSGEDAPADPLTLADALHRVDHRLCAVQMAAEMLDHGQANALCTVVQDAREEISRVVGVMGVG